MMTQGKRKCILIKSPFLAMFFNLWAKYDNEKQINPSLKDVRNQSLVFIITHFFVTNPIFPADPRVAIALSRLPKMRLSISMKLLSMFYNRGSRLLNFSPFKFKCKEHKQSLCVFHLRWRQMMKCIVFLL